MNGQYAIASVWYAVPGPGSATIYTNQSQSGTSVSASDTHSNTAQIEVSNQANFLGLMAGAYNVSYAQVWSKNSTTKTDSVITYTVDNTMPGPGFEHIDHNYDQILLLLSPDILFTGYSLNGTLNKLTWAIDGTRAIPYPVQVGWLNGAFGAMPANMASDLLAYGGITPADFPQIVAADPFAYDSRGLSQPSPDQYECVDSLYYIPGSPNIEGYQISNSYSSSKTTTISHSYTVKLALSATWLSQKINASDAWTWSNSSSTSNTSGNLNADRVNLHQPSLTYSGPTIVWVYVDKVYKSFLFSFLRPSEPNAYCQ